MRRAADGVWNRHLEVNTDPPIGFSLWAVDIQIPESDFAHAFDERACLLVARHSDLVAVPTFGGGVERILEVEMCVADG